MPVILGIESSCDDTAAAVLVDGHIRSNIIANQKVHKQYGGVVPELAARAHLQNIIPVVDQALSTANIDKKEVNAVAYTLGPGLIGSLLVGNSFAKSLSMSLDVPLIEVNHMQAHLLVHFEKSIPDPVISISLVLRFLEDTRNWFLLTAHSIWRSLGKP